MKALLIAPNIDGTDVGEAYVAFKWAKALSTRVNLTVLSFQRPERAALSAQLPMARVVTWPEPRWTRRSERLNAMLKPAWPLFCAHVRHWLQAELAAGTRFDIAHQIMPQAARYPSPLRHFPIPYVIGPLGGALDTPAAFRADEGRTPAYTRLRALDTLRLRHDPWLRASYSRAALVLGVAPYMQTVLADVPLRRFAPMLELGIDALAPEVSRTPPAGGLRLLHVGRAVRTKGLRDLIRALSHLRDLPAITLTSAGDGPDLATCRALATDLGLADRVTFLGRIQRADVETLYASYDIFAFPSFREPAGGVLYEAMRWGLPILTVARGGPDHIVDDTSGLRLPIIDPATLATDLARSIRRLHADPTLRHSLGAGARAKVAREGLWPDKADSLIAHYRQVLSPGVSRT